MMTREQYMDRADQQVAHREYYAQFVNERVFSLVLRSIGGEDLLASRDRSFNDIRLKRWECLVRQLPTSVVTGMKEAGDYLTLAGGVCVLKEAARQLVEKESK